MAFQVGTWAHISDIGGGGYQNFTDKLPGLLELKPNTILPVTVTPGFVGQAFKEMFRIYVDFNADGDFDDAGELAFDPGFAHNGPMNGTLAVPQFNASGLVRMRVMMKFATVSSSLPKPCESFGFGQVEDYCVELRPAGASSVDDFSEKTGMFRAFPQPATQQVTLRFPLGFAPDASDLRAWDVTGRAVPVKATRTADGDIQISTSGWLSGIYHIRTTVGGRVFRGKIVVTRI